MKGEIADELAKLEHEVAETGTIKEFEHPFKNAQGEMRILVSKKFPVRGIDGEIVSVGSIVTDYVIKARSPVPGMPLIHQR